uniref:AMP-dependent synthetase/ligase domain-containing protein n=1 Tax=Ditylenchus dipsaci TaxID=166011 RepID=A0A915CUS7_9BILA
MIKGPSITKGYYKDPEKTAELFDEDGFLHTGDVGHLQPNGTLKIIDRKKHIFKLAQGEYVAPEKIEGVYGQSSYVQQIYVDGDSLERYLVAIVTIESLLADLHKLGKAAKLNSIEQVKKVHIEMELFSVENGLLTPTMKSKRPQLRLKYKDIMKSLYKDE